MKPDREYGQIRYDQATGQWHPLGTGPTPGKTDLERGGFPHFINNNVGDAQRFQQVDAQGNIFGGSWDPAYNAAHFDAQGRPIGGTVALGDDPNARQQIMGGRSAQGFDPNNYVAPVDPSNPSGPYVSVVNGQTNTFATQNEAENDYNARSSGGSSQGAPPAGPSVGAAGPGSAGPAASPSGSSANPQFNTGAASAANAAVLAFLEQRRIDEIEKPELALKTQTELAQMRRDDAAQVWKQAYEQATLTGNLNGTPTLDAAAQAAKLTGYTGQGYASQAQQAFQNLPAAQRTGDAAARIWQNIVPGLSPQEAAAMNEAGHQYYAATGQVMPDAVAAQNLARITNNRVTGTGASPTPEFQHQQNQDTISALTLLSNLRGPENAFAYANTLANLPDSVRQAIGAGMQNLPLTARNPAQAGLLGDVTGQTGLGQAQQQVAQGMPAATGPRTTMGTDLMAAPGVGGMPVLRSAAVQPEANQQTQSLMGAPLRMNSATQAGIGANTGMPSTGGGVQTGTPALVAAPSVGAAYGPRTQPAGPRLPFNANQLSPTDMNRTDPYAQKVMWAGYENAGGDISSGQWQYQHSLPTATGPRTGRLRVA